MAAPPWPGRGPHPLSLATPAFFVLLALLAVFGAMLWYLWTRYPGRRRGLEGYFEAASIDLGFLGFGVALVVGLVLADPRGNETSWALYRVVLGGYWLTFAIPVVTVASSVESRSRGRIPWLLPSLGIAAAMFGVLFLYYYYAG
jgi:hypothetical protein